MKKIYSGSDNQGRRLEGDIQEYSSPWYDTNASMRTRKVLAKRLKHKDREDAKRAIREYKEWRGMD